MTSMHERMEDFTNPVVRLTKLDGAWRPTTEQDTGAMVRILQKLGLPFDSRSPALPEDRYEDFLFAAGGFVETIDPDWTDEPTEEAQ